MDNAKKPWVFTWRPKHTYLRTKYVSNSVLGYLSILKCFFSIVDPRNMVTLVSTWANVYGPLHKPLALGDEWDASTTMDPLKALCSKCEGILAYSGDTPFALHIQQPA